MAKPTKLKDVSCMSCGRGTNHDILASHEERGFEPNYDIHFGSEFQIIRCCGCDTVSFRESSWNSEDIDYETGKLLPEVKIFPDRASGRNIINGSEHFPQKTRKIYVEVLKAMNASCGILAAIGLRALIESICLDQKCAGKDLKERIGKLASQGLLSTKQAAVLHKHRFLGNVAAHEIESPQPVELIAALEIAETLLKSIYVIPQLEAQIQPNKTNSP